MRTSRLLFVGLLAGVVAVAPLPAQQVTLSLERFQKLWDQAHPVAPAPAPPQVPWLSSRRGSTSPPRARRRG